MRYFTNIVRLYIFALLFLCAPASKPLFAQQTDTVPKKQHRFWKEMLSTIQRDTAEIDRLAILRRNEEKYAPYSGAPIRHVTVVRVPFGRELQDTSRPSENKLVQLANKMHHLTLERVIYKNLFFQDKDTINPYLFADNERYLRELAFLRDADFRVTVTENADSVDVQVIVKDLFTLGGAVNSLGLKITDVQVREDNFKGTGNGGVLYAAYDRNRENNFAFGGELIRRNIGGLFIDQRLGYRSFYNSLRAPRQENFFYYNLNKPLLNRYMKFTYELDGSYHSTTNRYNSDSIYNTLFNYRYFQLGGWLGYNLNGKQFSPADESRKLRLLSGARIIVRKFLHKPKLYEEKYNWQFADLSGLLTSFTLFRQNFFKTQYMYGFGINEDIPEGLVFTANTGYTIKEEHSRPFVGLNFQQYGFLPNEGYLDYTVRFEGYLNRKKIEDINLLSRVGYFDRLRALGPKWKQRLFVSLAAAKQINTFLNEPLFINSKFGMPEYGSNFVGGDTRITANIESVFFSPWSLIAFKFAPLVSFNLTAFAPENDRLKFYSAIGAGVRTRNESLVFGTIELKGTFFPEGNFYGDKLNIELSTNVAFKYRSQFLQKPDFVEVN